MESRRMRILTVVAVPSLVAGIAMLLLREGIGAAVVTAVCVGVAVALGVYVREHDEARDPASPLEQMLRLEFDERVERARARQARGERTATAPGALPVPQEARRDAPGERPPARVRLPEPGEPGGAGSVAASAFHAPTARPYSHDGEPRWARSLRAAAQIAQSDPALALVAVRDTAALEVELAFGDLLRAHCPPELVERVLPCLPERLFRDERTRELWATLTGTEIAAAPAWNGFLRCLALRDAALHRGVRVTREQAEQAVAACARFLEHVEATAAAGPAAAAGAVGQENGVGRSSRRLSS